MKSRHEDPKRRDRFRCRCRKCGHRVFMELHPGKYSKGRRCDSCDHFEHFREDAWRVDWYRTSGAESRHQGACHCFTHPFPHRPMSSFRGLRCSVASCRPSRKHHQPARVAA